MQSLKNKFEPELRFDEETTHFGSNRSDEDEAPPSTLYDPSVLALSPELQARVAAREMRNQDESATNKSAKTAFDSPVHIFSPGAKQPSKPFEVVMDGKTIRAAEEDDGPSNDAEVEICCFGLLPRQPSLMGLYFLIALSGLVGIGIGANQIQISIKSLAGFGSAGYLIVSGVYVLASASVLVGVVQFLCGVAGSFLSYSRWKIHREVRWLDVTDRCFVLLLTILTVALTVINSIALWKSSQENIYDSLKWATAVQTEPLYACKTEMRLECGGFSMNECVFDNNETSTSFCPGHFCIDFCKIATDDVNKQQLCDACRLGGSNSVEFFGECKEFEKATTSQIPCGVNLNQDLRGSYRKLVIGALLELLALITKTAFSTFQSCCV